MNLRVLQSITEGNLGLAKGELTKRSRLQKLVDGRKLFSHTAKQFGYSEAEIAAYLHQDRATIYHSISTANDLIEFNKDFNKKASKIRDEIYEKVYSAAINRMIINEVKEALLEIVSKLDKLINEGGEDVLS